MTSSLDDIEPTAYNNMEADEEYCRRNDIHDLSSVVGDAVSQGVPDMDGQTTDSSKDPEPNSEDKKAFPPSSGSFFSPNLQGQRKKVLLKFVFTNCLLAIICFTMFVLFWGALYDTSKYLHKVKLLVVIQEPPVVILDNNSSMVVPSISYALPTFINKIPCDWDIYNSSTFQAKFDVNTPQQVNDKVVDLVYDEKYWFAINIKPNATETLFESLINDTAPLFNSTLFNQVVYETGRDPTNLKSTILPVAQTIEEYYHTFYTLNYLPALLTNITQVYRYALTDNARHIAAAGKYNYEYYDHRPFTDRILLAPTQIGVVYCLLLTFFQFLLYGPLHVEMAKVLRPANGLIYRIAMSWFTFFFASLFFCTTTAIFQVDFTKSFGRGGFVVYWMSTWLFMLAAGGANENAVMLVITLGPQYLGFWILSFVILNIAPSFFPLALNNNVYRYGYMMPVHNVIDIYRVIFFDVTRRKMGRNYGILVALIALNTALLPFVGKYASRKLKQKALVAAKQS
ncbi:CGH_1_collapsed_G0030260.mRNA.1.CDS.1 [Saccharomyces cerevisiae]|nr:BJ4_G0009890.mRNA.1.CDS.1 [Saccharomyces cerevisiae]CAI7365182.1 CGH_1_collapsed_G0030260.mRNA.1.CDS.1 [Saccharomyces cerevisiae]